MRKSRISLSKQNKLIEHFVSGSTARCAAELIGVNRNTSCYYFKRLRELIAIEQEKKLEVFINGPSSNSFSTLTFTDFFEKEEIKEKVNLRLYKPIFRILKYEKEIYTFNENDLSDACKLNSAPQTIVFFKKTQGINGLYSSDLKNIHINKNDRIKNRDIDNFWGHTKRYLQNFGNLKGQNLYLLLKECEWRWMNKRPKDQLNKLKQMVKNNF